jgi:hypothetical protein
LRVLKSLLRHLADEETKGEALGYLEKCGSSAVELLLGDKLPALRAIPLELSPLLRGQKLFRTKIAVVSSDFARIASSPASCIPGAWLATNPEEVGTVILFRSWKYEQSYGRRTEPFPSAFLPVLGPTITARGNGWAVSVLDVGSKEVIDSESFGPPPSLSIVSIDGSQPFSDRTLPDPQMEFERFIKDRMEDRKE